MRRAFRAQVMGLLWVLASFSVGAPVEAQSPLAGVFGEVLEVRVVNVEVVVTDREGVRVRGLQAKDFRLWVDGEEAPIDYFSEVVSGRAAALIAGDATAPAAIPSVTPGQPVGISYLLFIDDFFSIAPDRNQVLEALAQDLTLLGSTDRMAVVAFDGELEMLSTWSSSWPELQQVLKQAQERPAFGFHRWSERRSLLTEAIYTGSDFAQRLTPEELYYGDLLVGQVTRISRAVAASLRGFASPPGRKVLLLLSGGWPFDVGQYIRGDETQILLDRSMYRGRDLLRLLTDTANQLGYTVYPVDVPGMRRESLQSAEFGIARSPGFDPELVRENELHYTLDFVARETGGRAFLNAARLESLPEVSADTRSYYWLGFTSTRKGDDERHDIRVEAVRPELRARHREDYLDSSREAEVTMAVESALLFGNVPSGSSLQVEVGETRSRGRGRMRVPLTLQVPLDAVTLFEQGGVYRAGFELRVAARDSRGATAEIPVIPVELVFEEAPEQGGLARYETTLELRRRKHQLVVAVYDPATGSLLASTVEVEPRGGER